MNSRTILIVVTSAAALVACGEGPAPRARSATTQTTSASSDDVGSMSPTPATGAVSGPADVMRPDPGRTTFERRITADIQRRLLTDDALSATAKNVEIVTVGRKVYLRGEVRTEEEKARIEGHVRSAMGVTEVDDRLEVVK